MPRAGAKRRAEGSAPSEPVRKRFSSSFNETITVLVGPDEDKFIVHKTTACKNSPFFEAACSQRWTKGREKPIRLPDADPSIFETWLHWAYEKDLNLVEIKSEPSEDAESSSMQHICDTNFRDRDLCDLWALGNYLQDRPLRNRVIDELLEKFVAESSSLPAAAIINHAWDITPNDSKLRQLLLDMHLASIFTEDYFDLESRSWPQEFIMCAAKKWFTGAPSEYLGSEHRCRYHEHEAGEKKCA